MQARTTVDSHELESRVCDDLMAHWEVGQDTYKNWTVGRSTEKWQGAPENVALDKNLIAMGLENGADIIILFSW